MTSHDFGKRDGLGLRKIGKDLEDTLRLLGLADKFQERKLLASWAEIVGPDIGSHVQAVDIQDGVLILASDHGAWRQEVNMLAPQILEKFAAKHGRETVTGFRWYDRPKINRRGRDNPQKRKR